MPSLQDLMGESSTDTTMRQSRTDIPPYKGPWETEEAKQDAARGISSDEVLKNPRKVEAKPYGGRKTHSLASLIGDKPTPPPPGFVGRTMDAVKGAAKALVTDPSAAVRGGLKTVAGGAIQLGELATAGIAGLTAAAVEKAHGGDAGKAFDTEQARMKFVSNYLHDLGEKITGVNLAPVGKEEEAMARLLGVIPDAITSAGDDVYEKTGSAILGAGTQALGTLLLLKPSVVARALEGVRRGGKAGADFDAAAAERHDVTVTIGDYIEKDSPEFAAYLKARAAEAAGADPKDIGREAALAERRGWVRAMVVPPKLPAPETKLLGRDVPPPDAPPPEGAKVVYTRATDKVGLAAQAALDKAEKARTRTLTDPTGTHGPVEWVTSDQLSSATRTATKELNEALSAKKPTVTRPSRFLEARIEGLRKQAEAMRAQGIHGPGWQEKFDGIIQQMNKLAQEAGAARRDEDPTIYMNAGIPITKAHIEAALRFGKEFLKRAPGAAVAQGKLEQYYTWAIERVNPEALGPEAKAGGAIIAKHVAIEAQRTSSFFNRSADRRTFWNMRAQEGQAFIQNFEPNMRSGKKFSDPLVQGFAVAYKAWGDAIHAQDVKTGFKYKPEDHYFYHVFEEPDEVINFLKKRYGAKWQDPGFTKDREFDMYKEALAAGFKPKYTNPEDIMLARQHASDIAQMQAETLKELAEHGFARKMVEGQPPPDYPHTTRRSPTGEWYYVHQGPAAVIDKAFDSKGLWGRQDPIGESFRGLMGLKNGIVGLKLGLSLFHASHVMMIDVAAGWTREFKDAFAGHQDPVKLLGGLIKASTTDPLFSLKSAFTGGSRLLKVMQGKVAEKDLTAADKAAMLYMGEGGFIPEMSSQYKMKAWEKFKDAWERGSKTAAWHFPWAVLNLTQKPIFEHWIPSLKIASYLKDVDIAFRTDPSLLTDNLKRTMALRKIAKSIDNRYGEMAYNTMFWDRTFKDLMVLNTLSLSWQMGFVREYGGAVGDIGKIAWDGDKLKTKVARGDLDRPMFVTFYLMHALMLGGLISYLVGGRKPQDQEFKDTIYPIVGTGPDGKPQRVNTMQYTREFGSIYYHVRDEGLLGGMTHLAKSKASGILGTTYEWATGLNSFDQEIRNPNSPLYKKVEQTLLSTLRDLEPISIQQAGSTTQSKILSTVGFIPAPRYATDTKTEAAIRQTYHTYYAPKQVPYERALYSADSRKLRELYNNKDTTGYNALLNEMAQKYKLDFEARTKLSSNIKKNDDPLIYMFSRFSWQHQKEILDKATPEEREKLLRHSNKKQLRGRYRPPEEDE